MRVDDVVKRRFVVVVCFMLGVAAYFRLRASWRSWAGLSPLILALSARRSSPYP